ncbi:hypothetical protein GCM10019016_044260 [Streptomyces prasinosporus]|uniref:ATP-binding protein n=1 Tax=Streptomyces prasinosporus TaxID=68256 RepID=A0ABP6TR74_9ACTN
MTLAPPWGQREGRTLRGRDELIARILATVGSSAGRRIQVLYGLGGIGKTSVALEIAHRFQLMNAPQAGSRETSGDTGARVWWVSARDEEAVSGGLRAVAGEVGVSQETMTAGRVADALWDRLSALPDPWLLIIDNADQLAFLDGPAKLSLGNGWLRAHSAAQGLVVVTTRDGNRERWGGQPVRIQVEPLPHDDSAQILIDHAGEEAGDTEEAQLLAARLGWLPLALDTAGRYLADIISTPARFRATGNPATFRAYRQALEAGEVQYLDGQGLLREIWRMSLGLIEDQHPYAPALMELLAAFAPAPIPLDLLEREIICQDPMFDGVSGQQIWKALQAMTHLGLAEMDTTSADGASGAVSLHPLVRDAHHNAGLRALTLHLLQRAAESAGNPSDPANWPWWTLLTPHVQHAAQYLSTADESLAKALAEPVNGTIRALHSRGLLHPAHDLAEAALPLLRETLGRESSASSDRPEPPGRPPPRPRPLHGGPHGVRGCPRHT